jgi:hypothetical protein
MIKIAQSIERYNLAYKLAWKHISERKKREYPNVATFLHDGIRQAKFTMMKGRRPTPLASVQPTPG